MRVTPMYRVLDHLGPDAAKRMLRAWCTNGERTSPEAWDSCVIALAVGEPGELRELYEDEVEDSVMRRQESAFLDVAHAAAFFTGLSAADINELVRRYDDPAEERALRELIELFVEASLIQRSEHGNG